MAAIAVTWIVVRLAVAWTYQPTRRPVERTFVQDIRAAALVPAYNEEPRSIVATLRSLEDQTRPPDIVYVVDDGSDNPHGLNAAIDYLRRSTINIRVLPLRANCGKRHAQATAWAWAQPDEYDIWLLVDSDTTLAHDAVERMLEPFADDRVHAATSLILPRNRSIFARMQETEYANGILFERAISGALGAVPVMSGGFCAVRDSVICRNLDTYLAGYWGQHISDDRHLAILAGQTGRVVTQPAGRSYTQSPTHWRKYLRQRVRWQRGAWLGQFWTITQTPVNRWMWWVVAGHLAVFPAALALLVTTFMTLPASKLLSLWAYAAVLVWARSLRYLAEPHPRPLVQYAAWLSTPLQQILGILVLTPLKIYALATCRRSTWGTR
jgi:hyaluronan synthase